MYLSIAKLEGFQVKLFNTSAVFISWFPPQLPLGVRLVHYIVYYVNTSAADHGNAHPVEDRAVNRVVMSLNYGVVSQLSSNLYYHFWAEAVMEEIGGHQVTSTVLSKNATIFMPGKCYSCS